MPRFIIKVTGRANGSISGEYNGGTTESEARDEQAYFTAALWSGHVSICTTDHDGNLIGTDLPTIDVDHPDHIRSRLIEVRRMPAAAEAASCDSPLPGR